MEGLFLKMVVAVIRMGPDCFSSCVVEGCDAVFHGDIGLCQGFRIGIDQPRGLRADRRVSCSDVSHHISKLKDISAAHGDIRDTNWIS